jgi:GAF domain-containing protein
MEYPALVLQLSRGAITLQEAYGEVARHITDTVGCTRASLWLFTAGGATIELQALIDTRTGEISQGDILHEDDYPDYFSAITNNLRVIATEARSHPATECLSEDYLQPLDIVSLLDFVVLHNGHPAAILSCEHCGEQKQWTDGDVAFLAQMAAVFSVIFRYGANPPSAKSDNQQ